MTTTDAVEITNAISVIFSMTGRDKPNGEERDTDPTDSNNQREDSAVTDSQEESKLFMMYLFSDNFFHDSKYIINDSLYF